MPLWYRRVSPGCSPLVRGRQSVAQVRTLLRFFGALGPFFPVFFVAMFSLHFLAHAAPLCPSQRSQRAGPLLGDAARIVGVAPSDQEFLLELLDAPSPLGRDSLLHHALAQ